MWKKLYEFLERLVTLARRVSRHDQQIEELRQEVRELAAMVYRLTLEVNRLGERQVAEREKLELWVENQMLRSMGASRHRVYLKIRLQKTKIERVL
jgi:regulator of replication initiation timing